MSPKSPATPRTRRDTRTADDVLDEIRRRANAGRALNSGANRGDWLYASAVNRFGSWGAAVDAAGLDYAAVRQAALNPADVLSRLRVLVAEHGPNLRASDHGIVASGAVRHFGSWSAAFEAAGLPTPNHRKWTPATVIDALIAEMALGLPINAVAMNQRNAALYLAGRRRFGTWAATLAAVQKAARRLRKAPVGSLSMK